MMTIKKKKLPQPPMTIKYTVLLAVGVGSMEDRRSSRMGHTTLASSPSRGLVREGFWEVTIPALKAEG